jgi:hypothetical protein
MEGTANGIFRPCLGPNKEGVVKGTGWLLPHIQIEFRRKARPRLRLPVLSRPKWKERPRTLKVAKVTGRAYQKSPNR